MICTALIHRGVPRYFVFRERRRHNVGKFDGVLLVSDYDDTFLGTNRAVAPRNYAALD